MMKMLLKKRDEPFVYPDYYLQLQNWWAGRMSELTSGLSKTKLICMLILFIVLTGSYFIYNICATMSADDPVIKNTAAISKVKTINLKK
jgi:hypothetical protein